MCELKVVVPFLFIILLISGSWTPGEVEGTPAHAAEVHTDTHAKEFTGSVSCRECHERFYQLWSTSYHGLAMQPYTDEFAHTQLTAQADEIVIGNYRYLADIGAGNGWVGENGPEGKKKYPIAHAMGGKNVYYFLTSMKRGRLQTLPVAYDVRRKEWFDTALSGVRHFPGQSDDAPVNWKEWPYTFNTACYSCHVSQLKTNYDLKTDTYHTTWSEPGINCETCHGPAEEHIRVCQEAPKGQIPKDLKLTRGGRDFTAEQNNDTCAPCHAKLVPLSITFKPGDRFFDHFDLITLEHQDFYPDGRDFGENYTYTLWRMSPCVKSGQLSCLHCHTSSGRYRFKEQGKENDACLPCHQQRVENATAHTHHKADSEGNKCISCHIPMTEFARMRRSDHSMLPPTPATTIAYKSPNACNLCHTDQDASWSDTWIRKWRKRDYQAAILHRAGLIQAARSRDWSKLEEILAYIESQDREEVFTTSLIRLLTACEDVSKWPVLRKAIKDPSPLVRAAAAASMANYLTPENIAVLLEATRDDYRLVRMRSADTLANLHPQMVNEEDQKALNKASAEFEAAMRARPDDYMSYYNLANFYMDRGNPQKAIELFETALTLRPDSIVTLVNTSMAYARTGKNDKAKTLLARALVIDPENAEANFNMGLLKVEQNDPAGAERHLRTALKTDPNFPEAAYNLGVLIAEEHLDEAISWCRKAYKMRPHEPKYAFTFAYYLRQKKEMDEAVEVLKKLIRQQPSYMDAYMLLGEIYEFMGTPDRAADLYRKALAKEGLSPRNHYYFKTQLKEMGKDD